MPQFVLAKPSIVKMGDLLVVPVAHPAGVAALAQRQLERARAAFPKPLPEAMGKTALVLGSTTLGYGSSAATALRAAGFERIVGLGFENPPNIVGEKVNRASPGWYLTGALHAADSGITTYFADAFSDETRRRVFDDLEKGGIGVDLVLYSVATGKRTYEGETWTSALRVLGHPLDILALNFDNDLTNERIVKRTLEPGTPEEAESTRRVMGGEDLRLWIGGLLEAGLLNEGATVTALSYIGPEFAAVRGVYWDGTIGRAKQDIDATTRDLNQLLQARIGGKALTVMNPAVVTQASAVIPSIVTYLSAYLGAAVAEVGRYLDPLDVGIWFASALYGDGSPWKRMLDSEGRLRLDGEELKEALQTAIQGAWDSASEGKPPELIAKGFPEFRRRFLQLFGFEVEGVPYGAPAEFDVPLGEGQRVYNLIKPPPGPKRPAPTKEVKRQGPLFVLDHTFSSEPADTLEAARPAMIAALRDRLEEGAVPDITGSQDETKVFSPIPLGKSVEVQVFFGPQGISRLEGGDWQAVIVRKVVDPQGDQVFVWGETTLTFRV